MAGYDDHETLLVERQGPLLKVVLKQLVAGKQGIHRHYELMGLVNMATVQNAETSHGDPEDKQFFQMVMDVGLKKPLEFRNDGVDTDFTRI